MTYCLETQVLSKCSDILAGMNTPEDMESQGKLLRPSIECPVPMQWLLLTMLVSNHGCQILDFCYEQEKCQCIDSVPSVKTIATMSLWGLIQRMSSEFLLIKLISKLRSHNLQSPYFYIQKLFNVSACS